MHFEQVQRLLFLADMCSVELHSRSPDYDSFCTIYRYSIIDTLRNENVELRCRLRVVYDFFKVRKT